MPSGEPPVAALRGVLVLLGRQDIAFVLALCARGNRRPTFAAPWFVRLGFLAGVRSSVALQVRSFPGLGTMADAKNAHGVVLEVNTTR